MEEQITTTQSSLSLTEQYIKTVTKPAASTFVELKKYANWRSLGIQVVLWAIIDTIIQTISNLLTSVNTNGASGQLLGVISNPFLELLLTPFIFFVVTGILYASARLLGGKGTYLQQGYTLLLFGIPLSTIANLLNLLPTIGIGCFLGVHIYSLVLCVLSIMGVHQLRLGRAIATLIIPAIVLGLLSCSLVILFVSTQHIH